MGKGKAKTGKKPHKNKPTSKRYSKYTIEGDKVTRGRFCPRCGPGIFLMNAKNRVYCGKCHYSEFEGKPVEKVEDVKETKEEVKEEKKE